MHTIDTCIFIILVFSTEVHVECVKCVTLSHKSVTECHTSMTEKCITVTFCHIPHGLHLGHEIYLESMGEGKVHCTTAKSYLAVVYFHPLLHQCFTCISFKNHSINFIFWKYDLVDFRQIFIFFCKFLKLQKVVKTIITFWA